MFKNKTPEFWLIMTLTAIIVLCASMCSTRPADSNVRGAEIVK